MDLAKKWLSFRQAQTLQSSPDLGPHLKSSLGAVMLDTSAYAHGSSSVQCSVTSRPPPFPLGEQAEAPSMTFPVTPSQRREALLFREGTESVEGERESYHGRGESNGLRIALQPETRPITQDQLVTEVKTIHDHLSMMEQSCIELGNAKMSVHEPTSTFSGRWQAFVAFRRTLCQRIFGSDEFDHPKYFASEHALLMSHQQSEHTRITSCYPQVNENSSFFHQPESDIERLERSYRTGTRLEPRFDGLFNDKHSIDTQNLRRLFNKWPWAKGPMIALLWAANWAFFRSPHPPACEGAPATPTSTPLLSPTAAIGDVLFATVGATPVTSASSAAVELDFHSEIDDSWWSQNSAVGTSGFEYFVGDSNDFDRYDQAVFSFMDDINGMQTAFETLSELPDDDGPHGYDSSQLTGPLTKSMIITPSTSQSHHQPDIFHSNRMEMSEVEGSKSTTRTELEKSLPFRCSICGKTFCRKKVLERHPTEQHGSPAFYCPHTGCKHFQGEPFKREEHLVRHLRGCKHRPGGLPSPNDSMESNSPCSEPRTALEALSRKTSRPRTIRKKRTKAPSAEAPLSTERLAAQWRVEYIARLQALKSKERELQEEKAGVEMKERENQEERAKLETLAQCIQDLDQGRG